jgi:hypothetical protein
MEITKGQEERIREREEDYRGLSLFTGTNSKKCFWWELSNRFDYVVTFLIYLRSPNGQYCFPCREYHHRDDWLLCPHKVAFWNEILKMCHYSKITVIETLSLTSE